VRREIDSFGQLDRPPRARHALRRRLMRGLGEGLQMAVDQPDLGLTRLQRCDNFVQVHEKELVRPFDRVI